MYIGSCSYGNPKSVHAGHCGLLRMFTERDFWFTWLKEAFIFQHCTQISDLRVSPKGVHWLLLLGKESIYSFLWAVKLSFFVCVWESVWVCSAEKSLHSCISYLVLFSVLKKKMKSSGHIFLCDISLKWDKLFVFPRALLFLILLFLNVQPWTSWGRWIVAEGGLSLRGNIQMDQSSQTLNRVECLRVVGLYADPKNLQIPTISIIYFFISGLETVCI